MALRQGSRVNTERAVAQAARGEPVARRREGPKAVTGCVILTSTADVTAFGT